MTESNSQLQKISKFSFIAGAIGLVLFAFAWMQDSANATFAYLPSWLFWFGITVGSFALIMIHHLTSGNWGFAIRRIQETTLQAIPLCAILFIPIGLGMYHLYPWTDAALVAHDHVLQQKTGYLNIPFFWIRFVLYFVIWIFLAIKLKKNSEEQEQNPGYGINFRLAGYGGVGLVVYTLTITFATIDWIMAVEPHWFSTMYGAIFMIAFSLSSLAFTIIMAVYFSKNNPKIKKVLSTDRLHDLGTLLFASDMLWAYTSISQFIIIWSANLQEEAAWYIHRSQNGWWYVILAIFILHFILPFFLLLMKFIKRKASRLVKVAILLLIIRYVEYIWYVKPTFLENVTFTWVDIASWVGIGGIWLGFVLNKLSRADMFLKHDPIFKEQEHH